MVSLETKKSWSFSGVVLILLALLSWGCGGASAKAAESPSGASGGEMMTTESTGAPAAEHDEADRETVYARGPAAPPAPARGGVAQAGMPPPAKAAEAGKKEKPEEKAVDSAQPAPGGSEAGASPGGDQKSIAGPLLIYKANIFMAVFESKKAIDAVEKLAKENGGYLVSREDNRITVRVPSGKFDGTITQIAKLGDLLHRNVSVQDVTDEYYDMQTRLRNLEVVRARFEELLKKAANVTEAVAVERELERVTGEIERLKGRLKLLKELVTFSTITVEFQPRPVDHIDSKVRLPFPWLNQLGLSELLRL